MKKRVRVRLLIGVFTASVVVVGLTPEVSQAKKPVKDVAAPVVAISDPSAGSIVTPTTPVAGTSSDNVAVAKVEISVDSGGFQPAIGTSAWTFTPRSGSLSNGNHTLTAKATDTSGLTSASSVAITVSADSNPSPAPSPSATPSPSPSATPTTSPSPTPSQAPSPTQTPDSPLHLVTPEGVTIDVDANVTGWTASQVYDILKANAIQLSLVGPHLTIDVQTQYPTSIATSAGTSGGVYKYFNAIIYLDTRSTATFPSRPDFAIANEYGKAWALYHLYLTQQNHWTPWLSERGLLGDSRLESSVTWSKAEMIADDYRMLFGTQAAISQANYINPNIPDPRNVPGLRDWLLNTWAAA